MIERMPPDNFRLAGGSLHGVKLSLSAKRVRTNQKNGIGSTESYGIFGDGLSDPVMKWVRHYTVCEQTRRLSSIVLS